ncbi:MAG: TlpA family protein disulfide reductase [SAR202 cluster bacterium]|nr:TlpA family protein disulfide reductase [SAR202 cluster bacterium]
MTHRQWVILWVSLPLIALFGILGWALARSGANPGGLGVNSQFGEVAVASQPAPNLSMTTIDGSTIDLSALRGKVVMLDFWSSWCPPCRAEAPALSQVYEEYQGRPVEFVGIAIWDKDQAIRRFVNDFNVLYPNAIDPRGRAAILYGVRGIPEKFFIDAQGNVVKKLVGPINPDTLRRTLDELLATTAASSL